MDQIEQLREQLVWLIEKGHAHISFEDAIADLPTEFRSQVPPNVGHSPWQLLEHLRICQWDILEFSRDAGHVSPKFPHGYWPTSIGPPEPEAWEKSITAFLADRQVMVDLIRDPSTDLFKPIPHGDGQTILREAMLVADHNAYHIGQLVIVRKVLGCWS
ncbi:DinB family protein [Thalassoroseus pseudoceratinae]|uniref:DinB family protein n=1 Tax=Thalassoroseus pseudoceratinae TaxID=2713176 RepID=UPI00141FC13D|nr:DinB family protein [Thalassoroseus pseudoceratinae]